eukprot:1152185-Pelagomonas_calceolata.AAC.3
MRSSAAPTAGTPWLTAESFVYKTNYRQGLHAGCQLRPARLHVRPPSESLMGAICHQAPAPKCVANACYLAPAIHSAWVFRQVLVQPTTGARFMNTSNTAHTNKFSMMPSEL